MTIRYSGDTEVRIRYDARKRVYLATVADPYQIWSGAISATTRGPTDSRTYDRLALRFIAQAQAEARRRGMRRFMVDGVGRKVRSRRVFQAPCPL